MIGPTVSCYRCGVDVPPLAAFPDDNDHTVCVSCYEQTARANRPMTAADLTRLWGG